MKFSIEQIAWALVAVTLIVASFYLIKGCQDDATAYEAKCLESCDPANACCAEVCKRGNQ